MKQIAFLILGIFLLAGCTCKRPEVKPAAASTFIDRHMKNVTRLTADGDNGEAYFSRDGKKLIFQSSRNGRACDRIWTMNIDGSDKRMVSPDHGANTCSFFFPDGADHLRLDQPPPRRLPAAAADAEGRAVRLAPVSLQHLHGRCGRLGPEEDHEQREVRCRARCLGRRNADRVRLAARREL